MRSWDDYKKTMTVPESLFKAAKENDLARLKTLLDLGHDVNSRDHRGYSPLMLAAYSGNLEAVSFLISHGARVNLTDFSDNTPLMGVAFKGNIEIAKKLIDSGASLTARNKAGMDAFDVAHTFGRESIEALLNACGVKKRRPQRIKFFFKMISQQLRLKLSKKPLSAAIK